MTFFCGNVWSPNVADNMEKHVIFCFMIFPFTCPLIKYFPVKTCWTTEAKKKRYSTTFHDYSISSSSHYVPMIPPFIECKTHYQIIQF